MREILIRWIEEASKMKIGAKLNLVASSKDEQRFLVEALRKEINLLKKIDPEMGSTLVPFQFFKAGRFWVGIEKIMAVPTLGFVKEPDGEVRKVLLEGMDADRARRIKLMCEDEISLQEIEKLEGPLSEEELAEIIKFKEA